MTTWGTLSRTDPIGHRLADTQPIHLVRSTVHDACARPVDFSALGLLGVLEQLVSRTYGMTFVMECPQARGAVDRSTAILLYRSARTLLDGVLRKETAAQISVKIECDDDWLRLLVRADASTSDLDVELHAVIGVVAPQSLIQAVYSANGYVQQSVGGFGIEVLVALPLALAAEESRDAV
ncbi:signal transduction histidine kinase [Arthrobacter pigmenti]|uniref:Signal transduction histidine kinase n=1 Tax=Arthrobacter pigmenti TaxID=271432 RepID=A0A846RQI0_9MICC|nr:hypothetical protein [Arthrobacter pigmenti]NJC22654.1 signal transduction histidine kinase [Arthrobacter pigmenti]